MEIHKFHSYLVCVECPRAERTFPNYFLQLATVPLRNKLIVQQFARLFRGEVTEEDSPLKRDGKNSNILKVNRIQILTSSASHPLNSELIILDLNKSFKS